MGKAGTRQGVFEVILVFPVVILVECCLNRRNTQLTHCVISEVERTSIRNIFNYVVSLIYGLKVKVGRILYDMSSQ